MSYTATDVYGFAGGFTLGMAQAGFQIDGKRELPSGFGITNCDVNRHLLPGSWKAQAAPAAQWEVVANSTVVFGNPPCS